MTSSGTGGSNTSFSDISHETAGLARLKQHSKLPRVLVDPAVRQFKVIKFSHSKRINKPESRKDHFKELIQRKPELKPVLAAPSS